MAARGPGGAPHARAPLASVRGSVSLVHVASFLPPWAELSPTANSGPDSICRWMPECSMGKGGRVPSWNHFTAAKRGAVLQPRC